jgi:hypothetical protein
MKRVLNSAKKIVSSKRIKVDHLWEIIKIPIFILVVYSILTSFLPSDIYTSETFPLWIISSLVSLFSFGFIGYKSIKILNSPKFALKAGAYAGVIIGIIGALLGLVLIYFFPSRFFSTIYDLSKSTNLDRALIRTSLIILAWINLILGPLFNGLIGAFLSWLSALIFQRR